MRPDVATDYEWGRRHLPAIRRVLGEHLIAEAPFTEDARRATDLIVMRLEAVRIAVRMRRAAPPNYPRYVGEFTLRSRRSTGADTELRKVIGGWGDYLFYGWGDSVLREWVLLDLAEFRLWRAVRSAADKTEPGVERANGDGTFFRAYRLDDIPAAAVVAASATGTTRLEAV